MEAVRRIFSPEFRNRIDAIIQFAPLDAPTIERVVDKLVIEIEAQLEQKAVTLSVDDAARRWSAQRGYDPKVGARPMARVLQEHVKRPLAEEPLFGKLAGGGHVMVKLAPAGDSLELDIRPAQSPERLGQEERRTVTKGSDVFRSRLSVSQIMES